MKDISIIYVNFNTKDFVAKSIESVLQAKKDLDVEIIVVDNDSQDSSVEYIRQKFPEITLIENKHNIGFSKANNQAIPKASGKYILFLNPDTVLSEDTLSIMYAFMNEHKKAGAATCSIHLEDGTMDDASHRGFPTPWNAFCYFLGLSKLFPRTKLFTGYIQGWKNLNSTHEIDACTGAFIMVKKEAGEEIGWWDEDFFWYGEDLDLCFRLKEKDWKIYYVPLTTVLHYKGVSGGIKSSSKKIATADKDTKIKATRARFDAMNIFYDKHYKRKYPSFVTKTVLFGVAVKRWIALKSL